MPAGTRTLVVEAEHDGSRLDTFLTALLPEQSRSQIQRLIKDGRVKGPLASIRASSPVRTGQAYAVEIPAPAAAAPQPEAVPLRIVFEDPDIVVLDKPPRSSTRCCTT
jgi:23S rRNA pseudouridine1911/1915/1917 synthase